MTDVSRPSPRASRRRVLVVGSSPPMSDLQRRLGDRAIRAQNLFDAMGEISIAPASAPIDLLILSSSLAHRAGRGAVEAVRRLDPSVRLAALDDDPDAPLPDDLRRQFDGVLETPLSDEILMEVVGDDVVDRTTAPAEVAQAPVEQAATPAQPEPSAGETATDQTPPESPVQEGLGDVDLVEAALQDPSGLRETALSLIRQQTGWTDLHLAEAEPAGSAAVHYNDRSFGSLVSTQAAERELAGWAAWLARWLALDATLRENRHLAYRDDLTNAWNRRFYYRFMAEALEEARTHRRPITVMVFDIDDFKLYNDTYGHEAGDVILCETVSLLQSVIRQGDRVCRIGGDEFAVIFADAEGPREPGSSHPESVEQIAKRFQDQISQTKFPKLGLEAPGTLSISGGLATFPWDALTAEELLSLADRLAMKSKRKGKNAITFGPGAPHEQDH